MSLENPLFGSTQGRQEALTGKESEPVKPEPPKSEPEPMKNEPASFESVKSIKAERVRPERPPLQEKTLKDFEQIGAERLERAKTKFRDFKTSIASRMSSAFGRAKGAAKEALHSAAVKVLAMPEYLAAMPEIGEHAYSTVADAVQGKIAETKFQFSKGYASVIDKTITIKRGIELRGVDALKKFQSRVETSVHQVGDNLDNWRQTTEGIQMMERQKVIEDLIARARELGLTISQ